MWSPCATTFQPEEPLIGQKKQKQQQRQQQQLIDLRWMNLDTSVFHADTQHHASILRRLLAMVHQTQQFYSNRTMLAQALSFVPFDTLHDMVKTMRNGNNDDNDDEELILVRALMQWFKQDFFKWKNSGENCNTCLALQNGQNGATTVNMATKLVGMDGPRSREEQVGMASRVEVYQCPQGHTTRFPRYNNPITLLQSKETRVGRCGEWANAFAMLLSAVVGPQKVRYVMDWTDHVWVEYMVSARNGNPARFIHLDPCENAVDNPLMYESGWGKKLNLVVALNHQMVVDVTRRYTRKWEDVERRRAQDLGLEEAWLQRTLDMINYQLQIFTTPEKVERVSMILQQEKVQLAEMIPVEIKSEEQHGRTSGSVEWRRARGELGTKNHAISKEQFDIVEKEMTHILLDWNQFDTKQVHLNGSAAIVQENARSILRLNEAKSAQAGSAWVAKRLTRNTLCEGFRVEFEFSVPQPAGADGFAFVVQSQGSNALGESGSGLGYSGISHSLSVEFDTYRSQDRCDDPDANHVSVHTRFHEPNSSHHRFSIACTQDLFFKISDGKQHTARITYLQRILYVELDNIPVLKCEIDLRKVLGDSQVYLGFTASTGGLCEAHDITSWKMWSRSKHLPFPSQMFLFSEYNLKGMLGKILEFNQALEDTNSPAGTTLSVSEIKVISQLLQSKQHNVPYTEQHKAILERAVRLWPAKYIFPWIDVIRVLALRQNGSSWIKTESDLLQNLFNFGRQDSSTFGTKMLLLRLLANLFAQPATCDLMLTLCNTVMDEMTGSLMISAVDKVQVKLAYATVLLNYATALHESRTTTVDMKMEVFSAILETLSVQLRDGASTDQLSNDMLLFLERQILAAGTILLHASDENGSELIGLAHAMNFPELLQTLERKYSSVATLSKHLQDMLGTEVS